MAYNKYSNQKILIDGIVFSSKKEAFEYRDLKLELAQGVIKNLELQPKFILQEKFKDKKGITHQPIIYIADFRYLDVLKNEVIVKDVKGMRTDIYRLKKKLLLYKYPDINFVES